MGKVNLDDFHVAVFFMEDDQVTRQMRFSEFEAFLDGYVGLSDLADTDVKAVLVVMSKTLQIQSLVFFRIWFDEEGRADASWSVPIERLALEGARGPDLGHGPVRLVCRSQTPDAAWAEWLWDPNMAPGANHFQAIRRMVEQNRLGFTVAQPEQDIPVLGRESLAPPAADDADDDLEDSSLTPERRLRLATQLREQRLRIKTLMSLHRDEIQDIEREYRIQLHAQRRELEEALQTQQRLEMINGQLKQRLQERTEQYLELQRMQLPEVPTSNEDLANLLWEERLERKEREAERLRQELEEMRMRVVMLQARPPELERLIGQLQDKGLFLVAYHPGAGHLTIPYEELSRYLDTPLQFAAEACGVSEPAYRAWLKHYEHPVCLHADVLAPDAVCGAPVRRVGEPTEFVLGRDDRCHAHRPD